MARTLLQSALLLGLLALGTALAALVLKLGEWMPEGGHVTGPRGSRRIS
jgi:hypothetical protein